MKHIATALACLVLAATFVRAQDSLHVGKLGAFDSPGEAWGVTVRDDYAYLADGSHGLRVIDISDPYAPFEVGFSDTPGSAYAVALAGDYACVADGNSGLRLVNISDPSHPVSVYYLDTPGFAHGIAVQGYLVCIADYYGLRLIDISDPHAPFEVGFFDTPGAAYGVALAGDYAYVADQGSGLRVINVANPATPFEAGFYDTPGETWGMAIREQYAYIADGSGGFRVFNIGNPSAPLEVGTCATPWAADCVALSGDYAYVSDMGSGLRVIDITTPSAPFEVGFYVTSGSAYGVVTAGDHAVLSDYYEMSILDISYFGPRERLCDSTSFPLFDNFDSPELDSCWTWIRQDTSHWSLTERPGWMRIVPDGRFHWSENDAKNILLRAVADTNWVIEARLDQSPGEYFWSGIIVYDSDLHFLNVAYNGNVIRSHYEEADTLELEELTVNWNPCYLRIEKIGTEYTCNASPDSQSWSEVAVWNAALAASGHIRVGLASEYWGGLTGPNADFDYFRVDLLPGTNVCGDVSGVWDSTGSPYYVTCDVTVPAGQTLEIRPGVQVLFTGHYKFNVFGTLQAIGTEQDSILFTRAFPTEESKGWGIRFDEADLACSLEYCIVEQCHATPSHPSTGSGGGIYMTQSSPSLFSCTIRSNLADYDGGGVACYNGSSPRLSRCVIERNTANGDAGGALFHTNCNPVIAKCTIRGNIANGTAGGGGLYLHQSTLTMDSSSVTDNLATIARGGGLVVMGGVPASVRFSDFIGNRATGDGGGLWILNSGPIITGCTIDGNLAGNWAGGIGASSAAPRILNCTIQGNQAPNAGGGVYLLGSVAVLRNNIIAYSHGYGGLYFSGSGASTVDHNDIFGNEMHDLVNPDDPFHSPANIGDLVTTNHGGDSCDAYFNISADPLFVDTTNGDFHVQAGSPCIDAGDPNSPLDPDGTIADMGAFPYWHTNLIVSPASLDFGLLDFGRDSVRSVALYNPTGSVIPITGYSFHGSDFSLDTSGIGAGVPARATIALPVTFAPTSTGSFLDTLTIIAQQAGDSLIRIPLSGEAQILLPPVDSLVIKRGPFSGTLLHWAPVTHSVTGIPFTPPYYVIHGATSPDGPFVPVGATAGTSFNHQFILPTQAKYFYRVTAVSDPADAAEISGNGRASSAR